MQRRYLLLFLLMLTMSTLMAQKQPLTYFLPDINYDDDIPTPEAFLGYQIGEWHVSHDQQLAYIRALADVSPRITLTEYARTHENRPLVYLTVTSERNHKRLNEIKEAHQALSDSRRFTEVGDQPIVIYQGYSIHGNEPSGGNAALLYAYYLAAAKNREVERMLDDVVILLDPCFNPDGFHRFSTWVNMHKNKNLTSDSQDREYNEEWPRGRTNHYWFDLNRDWLLLQHPESQGRIQVFHDWKPNILTDHHEMGTNSTFFFMPGEPTRINPVTPEKNQELTGKIAEFHAVALDEIGSLYYSEEGYDDFYLGKGSTYPDANGCIGILFEQASARGHLQDTENGLLSFPFTIRNQVKTSISTQKAAYELREEILTFQREFYANALEETRRNDLKAFVFQEPNDKARLHAFIEVLRRHQIEVYRLNRSLDFSGKTYSPEHAFVVPCEQNQYRMVRGVFETITTFEDSLFYDVSSWTLPLAFNIEYDAVMKRDFAPDLLGTAVSGLSPQKPRLAPEFSEYAYLFEWNEYFAPKALNYLLKNGLRAKVAQGELQTQNRKYKRGTIMIPVQNQNYNANEIYQLVQTASRESGVQIFDEDSGLTQVGLDFGSRDFEALRMPRVLLLVGDGVSSYEAGEAWHLLDTRYDVEVTMAETEDVGRIDLSRYNTLIMVDGSYRGISKGGVNDLKDWVRNGGTLVAVKRAARWAANNGLANLNFRKVSDQDNSSGRRPYAKASRDRGSRVIGGAIVEGMMDLTHPLAFGYSREKLPLFRRGTLFFEPTQNVYASPVVYTDDALLSGYIKAENRKAMNGSASVVVSGIGSGRVVCMADNPNFRAFWYGTNKLFANAIFFGHTISGATVEYASGE
ncbi:MAG: zinc carboxypeptidase [Saprospiraceae bacterium]|nr:zinc carboxypeptidase [Saprospiraceae bacterium]